MVFLENYIDKRAIQQYSLLESPQLPLIFIILYLCSIIFGPKFMEKRKPFNLKYFIAIYNLLQVILCIGLIKRLYDGGFSIEYFGKCNRTNYSNNEIALNMLNACYLTFLIKGFEFTETIIFVLRKKGNQISYLHVYHHISTFIFSWFFARSIGGGMLTFSIWSNSIVHIFMYSYYFISVFGENVQKRLLWFKMSITTIQIVQFLILIVNTLIGLIYCNESKLFIIFYLPNIIYLLTMFSYFYRQNYLIKTKKH